MGRDVLYVYGMLCFILGGFTARYLHVSMLTLIAIPIVGMIVFVDWKKLYQRWKRAT